jgi:hypothetical protein
VNDKDEIIETEVEEKETIEGEVVEEGIVEEEETSIPEFDPNVILNTIMQSQDMGLRSVLSKLSISTMITKATMVLIIIGALAGNIVNYLGVATLVYGLYSTIYVLINYKKIKEHEDTIKDLFSKDGKSADLKQTLIKNLLILLICIPAVILSIYYRTYIVI